MSFLENDDESGIFLSILYLAREAEKRDMSYSAAKLVEAAYAVIHDCQDDPDMHANLEAAMEVYINFSCMDKGRIEKVLMRMGEPEHVEPLDNIVFYPHKKMGYRDD